MKASDVMTTQVITVRPDASVQDVARLLVTNRISAVPVVTEDGELVGLVSEGDLIRRVESGTEHRRSWWLEMLLGSDTVAQEFIKEHSRRVTDVMTRQVITIDPDTPVADIATLLENKRIKRVPVVVDGKVVGIVSRANLIQGLASMKSDPPSERAPDDAALRETIIERLKSEPWAPHLLNVTVANGVVDLWGLAYSAKEKDAARVAAEITPGVKAVNDNIVVFRAGAVVT